MRGSLSGRKKSALSGTFQLLKCPPASPLVAHILTCLLQPRMSSPLSLTVYSFLLLFYIGGGRSSLILWQFSLVSVWLQESRIVARAWEECAC